MDQLTKTYVGIGMEIHIRLAAFILFVAAIFFGWKGCNQEFFLLLAVAFELYAITEMKVNWTQEIVLKNWKSSLAHRIPNSISGVLAQFFAFICLVGFFLLSP
jgi:hypothetical protein